MIDFSPETHFPAVHAPETSVWRRVFRSSNPVLVSHLTAYLFLVMFIPSSLVFSPLGGVGTPALVWSLILSISYIASWMAGRIVPSSNGKPIWLAMIAFVLAVLASFIAAMTRDITQPEVLGADRGLIEIAAWTGLIVVVSQYLTTYDGLEILFRRAVIFGSIVAAIGIFEFYSGINASGYIQIPGLSSDIGYSTLLSRSGFNRPSSTAIDPIEFGVVMAMLLPFALHQAFHPGRRRANLLSKWLPVALIVFAIPITVSRSGIVGAAAGILFLLPTWTPQQRRGFFVALLGGGTVLKAAAPGLIGTLFGYFNTMFAASGQGSVSTRTADFSQDWPYILQRPLFGRGWGTFLPQLYSWTDDMYLNALIAIGAVGIGALLALYLAGLHCAGAGRRLAQDERQRSLGQAFVASIVVVCVGSATFDSLEFGMFSGMFFLILGATGAYYGIMKTDQRLSP